MSAAQLVERTRDLVLDTIKSEIASELAAIRTDRDDPVVFTDPPKNFYIFDGAHTYQCPAIFCVVDSMRFPDEQLGPNHVNALVSIFVSAVVEGQDEGGLTIKSERYQAALFKILQWRTLVDLDKNVKLWVRVLRCQFSPLYTKKRAPEGVMGNFRKEVSLELEIKHFENPTI